MRTDPSPSARTSHGTFRIYWMHLQHKLILYLAFYCSHHLSPPFSKTETMRPSGEFSRRF